MSAQAGVRRVPWRSRQERVGDPRIDWEPINGANGGLELGEIRRYVAVAESGRWAVVAYGHPPDPPRCRARSARATPTG